ncbi:MAG TPA: 6,7-dimethyl-8-ribityllumazine synthase, partial [Xanthomonadales bacterium]|nr:6,7-dimethyl-8-ribityllumazine synthase [Xanthomonadales bacterium]
MTASGSGAINSNVRIGIVASQFNQFIVDQLVAGARDALNRNGVEASDQVLVWVPGAFELPLMAKEMAMTGQFSAILALGAVIRGGTPHFEFV